MKENDKRPIGVFDSGLGGLTVVREIRKRLPNESIVYFGDMARLPYGTKSREQILSYSIQNTLFLLKHKVKAVVIACNSSSSVAYQFLKRHFNLPIVDVIAPAIESALLATKSGRIGVTATQATVDSMAYEKGLKKANPKTKVFNVACPLFVPLVEEGWLMGDVPALVAETYLKPLKQQKIDTLILGCTHYPVLQTVLRKVAGPAIRLVDSISPTVARLETILQSKMFSATVSHQGDLKVFVSDKPRNFVKVGESFLGEKMNHVEVVRNK